MRPSVRLINPASTYLGRAARVMSSGIHLVTSGVVAGHLAVRTPRLPSGWSIIADAQSASATERFSAFRDAAGTIVTVHAVKMHAGTGPAGTAGASTGPHLEASGRLIALVTFEPQRVSIAEAGPGRFDARWHCAGIAYRLHAGPTTLGAFMQLLMAATWS